MFAKICQNCEKSWGIYRSSHLFDDQDKAEWVCSGCEDRANYAYHFPYEDYEFYGESVIRDYDKMWEE